MEGRFVRSYFLIIGCGPFKVVKVCAPHLLDECEESYLVIVAISSLVVVLAHVVM